MATNRNWPQTADEWRTALTDGVGITAADGARLLAEDALPIERITAWFGSSFGPDKGFHADFVPALTRNARGLLAWAYGVGSEPFWPGSDPER